MHNKNHGVSRQVYIYTWFISLLRVTVSDPFGSTISGLTVEFGFGPFGIDPSSVLVDNITRPQCAS